MECPMGLWDGMNNPMGPWDGMNNPMGPWDGMNNPMKPWDGMTIYCISGQSSPACRFNFYHNNTLLTKDMPLDIELQHIKSSASSQIQTLAFLLQNSIKILG